MDLQLNINGDASGGAAAVREMGDELTLLHQQATAQGNAQRKQSEEFWSSVSKWAAAGAAAVTAFGVASAKAFMESDRNSRQLKRAAGEYADELERQAAALQAVYAVDDDIIKQSQTLLVQWGGVGAATQETTKAVLDYAAATGQDAVNATQDLIRNVESGGKGMAKLGIHYDATGEKSEDLARLTQALADKYGGAAGADADSLHGQVSKVSQAFSDLQEDIGGMIASFNVQYGITGKLTEALRGMQTLLGGGDVNDQNKRNKDYLATLEALNGRLEKRKELARNATEMEAAGSRVAAEAVRALSAENEKAIRIIREGLEERRKAMMGGALPAMATGDTNAGIQAGDEALKKAEAHAAKVEKLHEKNVDEWKKYLKSIDDVEEASRKKDQENYAGELEMSAKRVNIAIKEENDKTAALQLSIAKDNELYEKQVKYRDEAVAKMTKEANDTNAQAIVNQVQKWNQAGDSIGAAFVDGLSEQLQKLSQGEEFDVAIFVGDILASAVAIAGTAIGSAYGQPQLGAALGNLAAMGVRAGAGAISKSNKKAKTMHSGGPVGDEIDIPRYHSGGPLGRDEMHIIAQKGEHMLSRQDVSNMGGHAGVEAFKRGGPTINNYIKAIDSKSAAESFMADLGQGMKRAMRTGHGDVPRLLGWKIR